MAAGRSYVSGIIDYDIQRRHDGFGDQIRMQISEMGEEVIRREVERRMADFSFGGMVRGQSLCHAGGPDIHIDSYKKEDVFSGGVREYLQKKTDEWLASVRKKLNRRKNDVQRDVTNSDVAQLDSPVCSAAVSYIDNNQWYRVRTHV